MPGFRRQSFETWQVFFKRIDQDAQFAQIGNFEQIEVGGDDVAKRRVALQGQHLEVADGVDEAQVWARRYLCALDGVLGAGV